MSRLFNQVCDQYFETYNNENQTTKKFWFQTMSYSSSELGTKACTNDTEERGYYTYYNNRKQQLGDFIKSCTGKRNTYSHCIDTGSDS